MLGQAQESAFIELNRDCVLHDLGFGHPIKRWRDTDSWALILLVRLPVSEEVGQTFGWKEASNQHGGNRHRYPRLACRGL